VQKSYFIIFFSFGLRELENGSFGVFFEKNGLSPLGVKHLQNEFFGGLDVIVTTNFYQVPLVRDKWVFQRIDEGLNP
jgi:hypothetical protein